MANAEAWGLGWQMGANRAVHERDRKEALADEQRQLRMGDLHAQTLALANAIKALPEGSPERKKKELALTNARQSLLELHDPIRNPGALHKDWDLLVGLINRKKPVPVNITSYDPTTSPATTITPEAQSITLAPGEQPITLPSAPPITIPGTTRNVRPAASAMTPQQRQQMAHRDQARAEAAQDIEAAGLTPDQEQTLQARAELAGVKEKIKTANEIWDQQNQGATEEDKKNAHYENFQRIVLGVTGANLREKYYPNLATTTDAAGTQHYYRVPMEPGREPEEVDFNGQVMAPKANGKPKGLSYDPKIGMVRDGDTGQLYSLEDAGKPGSPPRLLEMFNGAKAMMDMKQRNALALANERGLSYAANRYGSFVDPANPTQVIPVPFGEAARRGLHLAVGAQYQTMAAMLKSATSGPIGNEIVAFSTALQHADLLEQAAKNLNNPDTRVLARISNDLATQFGDERPTNFNVIANAYTREVTKALTSGHVTDNEIQENGATIPRDASPEQILGAIASYRRLMQSKINLRRDQILSGLAGKPYLGSGGTQPPAAQPAGGGKGSRSLAAAMALPSNHGKSAEEVEKDLAARGYTVTRP